MRAPRPCRRATAASRAAPLTLEQAIITAVLSGAAIALAIVVGNAILSHSANIR